MTFKITLFITDGTSNNSCHFPLDATEDTFESTLREKLQNLSPPLKHSFLFIQFFYMSVFIQEIQGTAHQILPKLNDISHTILKEIKFMKDEVIKENPLMNE